MPSYNRRHFCGDAQRRRESRKSDFFFTAVPEIDMQKPERVLATDNDATEMIQRAHVASLTDFD
ncbi:hypothetical protein [Caballeronia sp. LZ035]|uniref:hypothetical protein n=1 Tax=Caballeronia sp. LZ035 TaxID=3038568 RepID=UPI00285C3AEA|nr:hypothetical protein [Caballeronia sp. LZ035]MDR5758554.1 hypothetical protein [Caballeronia sp. LZ035]